MGLFGESKKENCSICGKEVTTGLIGGNGVKLKDAVLCSTCLKKYGGDGELNLSMIENRMKSEAMVEKKEFIPTKTVYRVQLGIKTDKPLIEIDEKSGLINMPIIRYGFLKDTYIANIKPTAKIINFELLENGNTISDGSSIIRAGVGGLLFGGAGAIVGAGTGSKSSKTLCKSMKIKVTFDDLADPVAYIDILGKQPNGGAKNDSGEYIGAFKTAQECLSVLSVLLNRKKDNASNDADKSSGDPSGRMVVSVADEILKFKQLLDMGAITQEEFDAKKKELLGL